MVRSKASCAFPTTWFVFPTIRGFVFPLFLNKSAIKESKVGPWCNPKFKQHHRWSVVWRYSLLVPLTKSLGAKTGLQ